MTMLMCSAPLHNAMDQRCDTVVIGGGQSGLAVGYYLAIQGREFVILDAHDRVGAGWRNRWDSLRLFTPARWWATIAAWGEFVGGLLLVLGLFTPLAALLVLAVMLVAILKVHASKGFWNSQGGYEYNLVLSALATVLGLVGAGAFALDALLGLSALSPTLFLLGLPLLILLGVLVHQPTSAWFQKRWHSSHVGPEL